MSRVIYFDLRADNPERTAQCYRNVFNRLNPNGGVVDNSERFN